MGEEGWKRRTSRASRGMPTMSPPKHSPAPQKGAESRGIGFPGSKEDGAGGGGLVRSRLAMLEWGFHGACILAGEVGYELVKQGVRRA